MVTDATTAPEADAQDLAEVFDETNLTKDSHEIANVDDLPDDLETEPEDALTSDDDDEDDAPDEAPAGGAADRVQRHQDDLLDEGVEETFPASDPVSVKRIT